MYSVETLQKMYDQCEVERSLSYNKMKVYINDPDPAKYNYYKKCYIHYCEMSDNLSSKLVHAKIMSNPESCKIYYEIKNKKYSKINYFELFKFGVVYDKKL